MATDGIVEKLEGFGSFGHGDCVGGSFDYAEKNPGVELAEA